MIRHIVISTRWLRTQYRRWAAFTLASLLLFGITACSAAATLQPVEPTLSPQESWPEQAAPTAAPSGQETTEEPAATAAPVQQPTISLPTLQPAVMSERRLISLDWPKAVRVGDSDTLWLRIEVDESGKITPTVRSEGHEVTGRAVEIPDLYETHVIKAVARLDISGMTVTPEGEEFRQMLPNKTVEFAWSVSPQQEGLFRGTLWVYMDVTPKTGGLAERETLMAVPLEIEGRSIIGLPANVARWGGLAGTGLSMVLGFPFLEQFIAWLWRRLSKARARGL